MSGFVEAFTTPIPSSIQQQSSAGKRLAQHAPVFASYQLEEDLSNNVNNINSRRIQRLFGKKNTNKSSFRAISALPFLLLKRLSLGSSAAWAASKATSIPAFNMEEILSYRIWYFLKVTAQNILTSLRHPTKDTLKAIAYTLISIYLLTNIVEGIAASKRQKLDATSEWGRYADKPAARGQALSLLMMRLTPYAILPSLLDKFSKKKRDDLNKEDYESTRAHKLRRRGGEIFADGLLTLGPLYVKIGKFVVCFLFYTCNVAIS